jgi:hypothetical protein
MKLIKQQLKKKIILVIPSESRPPNSQLKRWAMCTLRITQTELSQSQLPNPIPGTTFGKPNNW